MHQGKFSLVSPRLHEGTFLSTSVLDIQADLDLTPLHAASNKEKYLGVRGGGLKLKLQYEQRISLLSIFRESSRLSYLS